MPASSSPNPTERLYGLDLVRFVSFYAIVVFHLSYTLWGMRGHLDVPVQNWSTAPFEFYARALSFSGFSIIFISFFLFGLKPGVSRKWSWLWIALLIFLAVWNFTTEPITEYYWDIYPFLLAVFALISAARFVRLPPIALAVLGLVLTSIPFWQLQDYFALPRAWKIILFGHCEGLVGAADWPLLPWVGYPLLAFAAGGMARTHRAELAQWGLLERGIWALALLVSLYWLGDYYPTQLGGGYACYAFRRPIPVFWAHQIWILFAVRISLLSGINGRLAKNAGVRWISRRTVNRMFFLAYFIHYPLCFAAALAAGSLVYAPFTYPVAFFAVVLLIEAVPFVIAAIFRNNILRGNLWGKSSAS